MGVKKPHVRRLKPAPTPTVTFSRAIAYRWRKSNSANRPPARCQKPATVRALRRAVARQNATQTRPPKPPHAPAIPPLLTLATSPLKNTPNKQPKEVLEIKKFLLLARAKDAKSCNQENGPITKFKVRTSRTLWTLRVADADKAEKLGCRSRRVSFFAGLRRRLRRRWGESGRSAVSSGARERQGYEQQGSVRRDK